MADLKAIKRRIATVAKTQQITRAMRMVAAAKLRRATESIESARPYAERMRNTLGEVAGAQADAEHPLLAAREQRRTLEVVVVTSDRGLAGAFNANVLKHAEGVIKSRGAEFDAVSITAAGRKAGDYYRRHRASSFRSQRELSGWIDYDTAAEMARELSQRFLDGDADEVVLVYSEFRSTVTQAPRDVQLLPFAPPGGDSGSDEEAPLPYSIEPSPEKLLATLVPKAVEIEIFRALLENQAGEHAARMTAMESATRNTEELIEKLTLDYNRARQAAITRELVEIVTGAQALEG